MRPIASEVRWCWDPNTEIDRRIMAQILSPGTQAPDFTLNVTPDQKLSLHELQGKPVILAFYPPTGVRCAEIRWHCTTRLSPNFKSTRLCCSGFPRTEPGVTPRLRET